MRVSLVLLLSAVTCGCGSAAPQVFLQGQLARDGYTEGDLKTLYSSLGFRPARLGWFTPAELDRIARLYAKRHAIPFDFRGADVEVEVPRDRSAFATVVYEHGLGRPFFSVTIAPDGAVTEHHFGTAVCDLRDLTQPTAVPEHATSRPHLP